MNETKRQQKMGSLLQQDLADILQQDCDFLPANGLITVSKVRVTPDLAIAKIYLSIFKLDVEQTLALFTLHKKSIRHKLGQKIRHQVRIVPDLIFYADDSLDYADRIDKLLKETAIQKPD